MVTAPEMGPDIAPPQVTWHLSGNPCQYDRLLAALFSELEPDAEPEPEREPREEMQDEPE